MSGEFNFEVQVIQGFGREDEARVSLYGLKFILLIRIRLRNGNILMVKNAQHEFNVAKT